ncbi:alpha/beta hydrolase [Steroidobacter flavus]|uniref:Alpha/beta hydrolase n=1 Tax=Steroidobacter flavus TaxID=1842136 RepID=A0ABV8SZE9_9GAMM
MMKTFSAFVLALVCWVATASADDGVPVEPSEVLKLWPGVAPGSEQARHVEKESRNPFGNDIIARNVVSPTLAVYLPAAAKATGTGVIIAPGGGFRFLSMNSEGHDVARWLAARGIAAFVLKYRLVPTPADDAEFRSEVTKWLMGQSGKPVDLDSDARLGINDGLEALKLVRQRAKDWHLAPERIGFMGFSAGAMVTTLTALQAPADGRPAFAAPIYGAAFGTLPSIPVNMPPVFLAYASNDDLVRQPVRAFYDALLVAGQHPELHVYRNGGHGFGLNKHGTSSDFWIEDFYNWLGSLGLTKAGVP